MTKKKELLYSYVTISSDALRINRNAKCYYETALKFFLPVEVIPEIDGFRLNLGKQHYYFSGVGAPFNNSGSIAASRNKYSMNRILDRAGFPVPKATSLHISEYQQGMLEEKISKLSFPLVAKPLLGKLGRDVLCNIQTIEQLKKYLDENLPYYEFVTIEEFHGNLNSYRVLIFNKRVIGVVQRYPAEVCGDGIHTLRELIDITNDKRLTISDTLSPITVDEECEIRLNELGLDLSYVPKKDESVILGYTSNASRGGTYCSLGNKICKENRRLLIRAANELNITLVGFDVQCTDINIPIETSQGIIIEANDGPSVRIHEYPMAGYPVKVTRKIIRSYIYRHPLLYLKVLYENRYTALYFRVSLLVVFLLALTVILL